ncbi:MAG TPA: universal stress protein [Candidatus Acidoferrales bacterium]|nr:universal stress protein [Candidatus Acidoferrales bacterium]
MYTKIIVPLDGSALAEAVLPHVRTLARQLELPITLLQVIDPEVVSSYSKDFHQYGTIMAAMKLSSGDYLRKTASLLGEPPKVDSLIEVGAPADTIVRVAAQDERALIAMATHGLSGLQRWIMGSVANKVLRAASNHLFLIRPRREDWKAPTQEEPLTKIIVPLDGSKLAEKVLPHAVEWAQKMSAEIVLVRVYTLPLSAYWAREEEGAPNIAELEGRLRAETRDYLDAKVEELKAKSVRKVSSVLLEGLAAARIVDFARETPGSLIAMCTHGRSGMKRWVLGSVTERVVQASGNPVLVIRT